MKHMLKEVSEVQKQLDISVPSEDFKKSLDAAYHKIGQKAHLKGFRPGKAPRAVLEKYYRQDAESDAVRELIDKVYPEAVRVSGVIPVNYPAITITSFGPDKDFAFQALFDVRPIFEVKGYQGLKLEKDSVDIQDQEVDDQIKNLQERMAQLVPLTADRKTQTHDVIVMDYQGYLNKEPIATLSAKDSTAELGKNYLFPELELGLLNMTRGEKKKIKVTFPEAWVDKKVAGQAVDFEIELKDIKEKKLPELNDDFAKDVGNFTSFEDLKKRIQGDLSHNKEQWAQNRLRRQVIEKLIEKNPFSIPNSMIESELEHMLRLFESNLKNQGMTLEKAGVTRDDFFSKNRDEAAIRVKGALIFDAVAQKENVTITAEEVDRRIEQMARAAGQSADSWKSYYQKNNMLSGIAGTILEEKTLAFVLSQSKIEIKR